MVTHDRTRPRNPRSPPWTVTVSPGAASITIGAAEVPELATSTTSAYVPPKTRTVSPATARSAPSLIVHSGSVSVAGPPSEQLAFSRST